jgi:hypothetical protein
MGIRKFALSAAPPDSTDEVQVCLQKAACIGRLFAETDFPHTIRATWGIRPTLQIRKILIYRNNGERPKYAVSQVVEFIKGKSTLRQ